MRGKHLLGGDIFLTEHEIVQQLLEDSAYLKPGAY